MAQSIAAFLFRYKLAALSDGFGRRGINDLEKSDKGLKGLGIDFFGVVFIPQMPPRPAA
jgi:hypothetical protein